MSNSSGDSFQIRLSSGLSAGKLYLICPDLFLRFYWTGCVLGFNYHLQPGQLRAAAQRLVDEYFPSLTGRLRQDSQGRFFVDDSNAGFCLRVVSGPQEQSLSETLPAFVHPAAASSQPVNALAQPFFDELEPAAWLAGQSPLLSFRLTQVKDGSILGVSVCHALADAEGVGQMLLALSNLYQGRDTVQHDPSRLKMQSITLQTFDERLDQDAEVLNSLPIFEAIPPSFQDLIDQNTYDAMGLTAAERKAGVKVSHQVLHIPGTTLGRLREAVQASSVAQSKGISCVTSFDVMAAVIWILREAAAGNDLSSGLKQCFAFLADLRRFSKAQPPVPATHWGNAFGIQFVMPLSLAPPHEIPAPGRVDFQQILATAACAINSTLKDAREDPAAVANVLNFFGSTMHKGFFKEELDAPGFSPTRDMICGVSSWRNQSVEKVNFGQGRPWAVAGKVFPISQKQAFMMTGPGGDGMVCMVCFKDDGFEQVQSKALLQKIAPDAKFLQAPMS